MLCFPKIQPPKTPFAKGQFHQPFRLDKASCPPRTIACRAPGPPGHHPQACRTGMASACWPTRGRKSLQCRPDYIPIAPYYVLYKADVGFMSISLEKENTYGMNCHFLNRI